MKIARNTSLGLLMVGKLACSATPPVSSRVKSQAPTATSCEVKSTQGFLSRTMAFKITTNFRIQATTATIFAFPAATKRL
jgi:hypothetical protein